MKLKRNVLICAVLLLAAFWLQMRNFAVHFTPEEAFQDYYLGLAGRVPAQVGEYDGGGVWFYFVQDSALGEDGGFAEVFFAERFGPFWQSGGSCTVNNGFQDPVQVGWASASDFIFLYAFKRSPEVARISLRVDRLGEPSRFLDIPQPYGDIYFWYLPDCFPGQDLEDVWADCKFVFTACDENGSVLHLQEV